MKRKIYLILFLFLWVSAYAGDFCVFPFENLSLGKEGNFRYSAEVFLECCLNSSMCERIEAVEEMDLPLDGDFTYATQLMIAEKIGSKYLINGSYAVEGENIQLTVRVFELNGEMRKFVFTGGEKEVFDKLESIAVSLGGKCFFRENFNIDDFKVFSSVLTLACVYKDFAPALKKADFFKGKDFYSRKLMTILFNLEENNIAFKYFENLKNKSAEDYLVAGLIKVKNGHFADAESFFKKANALNPSDIYLNNIAGCMVYQGEIKASLKLLSGLGDGYADFNKAVCYALDGDYKNALHFLSLFASEYGLDENGRLLLSFILEKKGIESSSFEKEVSESDVKECFIFNDGKLTLTKVSDIMQNYKKIGLEAYGNKDYQKTEEYLKKYFVLNPFDKEVCKILCSLSDKSDACIFLSLGE